MEWHDWKMTGVRQGCILSPVLFALAIDWVMRTALTSLDVGVQWTDRSRLSDLDYADDIVLLETSRGRMQQTETVDRYLQPFSRSWAPNISWQRH